jgi:NADPH-dependent 2,4-dienoyl-CoA reductase/sulfur reductase-like enzyme
VRRLRQRRWPQHDWDVNGRERAHALVSRSGTLYWCPFGLDPYPCGPRKWVKIRGLATPNNQMSDFDLIIVGGGLASARAIKTYREADGDGRIALVSSDRTIPYHRPPLSKRYLRGEVQQTDTHVESDSFYVSNGVELILETEVVGVDPNERSIATRDGNDYRFQKLLLATGAVPRQLDVAGTDLPGVFTLRSLSDSTEIREAAAEARDAVVVGSGFIGMEVAASLSELELDVTLVSRDVDLFSQLGSPEISERLVALYLERGVDVVRGDEVRAFRGHSHLDTIELHAGQPIAAGLAVVGVGVQPAVSFLEGSGIALDNGIVVNQKYETNAPSIYAAGDVACFFDPLFARRRRIEHWSNANYQGGDVGRILAGDDGGYDTVSTFFTESFGLMLKVFGDTTRHDDRLTRGSFLDGSAIAFYLENERLVATLHTGQDDETEETLKRLIRSRAKPRDLPDLADQSVALDAAFHAHTA